MILNELTFSVIMDSQSTIPIGNLYVLCTVSCTMLPSWHMESNKHVIMFYSYISRSHKLKIVQQKHEILLFKSYSKIDTFSVTI